MPMQLDMDDEEHFFFSLIIHSFFYLRIRLRLTGPLETGGGLADKQEVK